MDLYEILEVNQKASSEVIKMAYKALVKKYHPDVYLGDKDFAEEKMKQLNEAYSVLSDPNQRLAYDSKLNHKNENTAYSGQARSNYSASSDSDNYKKNSNNNDNWDNKAYSSKSQNINNEHKGKNVNWRIVIACILILFFIKVGVEYVYSDADSKGKSTQKTINTLKSDDLESKVSSKSNEIKTPAAKPKQETKSAYNDLKTKLWVKSLSE